MSYFTPTPERAAARAVIVEAFDRVPYPGDAVIPHKSTAYWHGVYGDKYEGSEIFALFRGKRWQDVDLDMLRCPPEGFQQGAFTFLSHEGVGYYAPALMLIALDHGRDADLFLDDAVDIFGPGFSSDPAALEVRVGRFTDQQKRAVAMFLKVMADDDFALDASSSPRKLLDTRWAGNLPTGHTDVTP